ncbi:hypothetical protein AQUCO_00200484v1 [Aquilegia coerulea]|uniref:DYW domain-containing protein n=1 Tax=Aquilegia coerulea TaxID=218851 RepID=A0A2G5F3M2_AQUCA|nr:hypothetical protein AQUCO_00200484v1 [Aquilegia coerulea]
MKHPLIVLLISCKTRKQIKQIHTQMLINGLLNQPHLLNQFVSTIALNHPNNLDYSNQVLEYVQNPTVFTLNSMIKAHSKSSSPHYSFHYYNQILQSSNLYLDNYTFTYLVRTCTQILSRESGFAVHAAVIKHGFEFSPYVQCALVHMYAELGLFSLSRRLFMDIVEPDLVIQTTMVSACAKLGEFDFARKLFDEMTMRDSVAWNALIAGYVRCGRSTEALDLFHLMQREGVMVNEVVLTSVLSACSHLCALDQGRWVHGIIERNKIRMTVTLGSALIDMYTKCGDMGKAMEVFWMMKERNVYTWSSAMSGLAMNGAGKECLEIFSLMKEGVQPNEVTFVAVLQGCSVVGSVDEGCRHFESMKQVYGVEPRLEHYGCMVDLYGRAGQLDDAIEFINNMPMKPHTGAWGALLRACKIHGNAKLGELALQNLVELNAGYVLLSNLYANSKDWDRVNNVRETMKAKGMKKVRGCSVMEADGEVHQFFVGKRSFLANVVGRKSHPRFKEIKVMLEEIARRLRLSGSATNTDPVLFNIDEEEKEAAMCKHSEMAAIAFGLISLEEGLPIRIVKNHRICGDSHEVIKIISKFYNREIIIRDRDKFHHFKNGECSCKDYW